MAFYLSVPGIYHQMLTLIHPLFAPIFAHLDIIVVLVAVILESSSESDDAESKYPSSRPPGWYSIRLFPSARWISASGRRLLRRCR